MQLHMGVLSIIMAGTFRVQCSERRRDRFPTWKKREKANQEVQLHKG